MQLVVGAAPALAGGTSCVEPTGEGEEAVAAKPKLLAPWVQDKTKRGREGLSREGKRMHEPPPEALPQGERE